MNGRNLQRNHVSSRQEGRSEGRLQRLLTDQRNSSGARLTSNAPLPLQDLVSQDEISKQMERTQKETHARSEVDSDSSLPSPMREQLISSDVEASGEESDPQPPPGKTAVWIVKRQGQKVKVLLVLLRRWVWRVEAVFVGGWRWTGVTFIVIYSGEEWPHQICECNVFIRYCKLIENDNKGLVALPLKRQILHTHLFNTYIKRKLDLTRRQLYNLEGINDHPAGSLCSLTAISLSLVPYATVCHAPLCSAQPFNY